MKIVIDIPEEIYYYVDTQWRDIPKIDSPISIMCNAIIDGKLLPKGHGRIIDESKITQIAFCKECEGELGCKTGRLVFGETDAPTIIEADKEGNNADNI